MATKLFLRNTTNNGITDTGDGILYDLSTTAGSSVDTAVTNTTASGTQIQATKTAGGSTIAWISGRAPAGGFTLTNTDFSAWQVESNMNANIGGRYRVFKRAANGTITEIGGGPFTDDVEMNTADREDTWLGNVTDTAFAEDDRILIRYYITNIGTMASGHTGTLKFNAADGQTGDSFFNIAETVTFKANAQTISAVGNIASVQAFGTTKLNRTVSPSGVASAQAFGAATVSHEFGLGDALVSFWKLGENSGSGRNDSAGTNNLSELGGSVSKTSPGKVGDAAGFNETGYLRVADNPSLSITGNLSICGWVRVSSLIGNDFPGIATKWAADNRSYALRYDRTADRFTFDVSSTGTSSTAGVVANTFGAVPDNTWCFLQAYADLDTDQINLRVGTASSIGTWETPASFTASSIFDGSADLEVGRLGTSGNVFYGDIDAVGLWSRRLSEGNWSSLWNNGNGLEIVSPIAKAGYDQKRMELTTAYLDGTQSVGDGLSYSWTQLSGTTVTLNNATTPTPNFTTPDVSVNTDLVFRLTVTEADLDTAQDDVTVTVVPTGSNAWLSATPGEVDMDPDLFYPAFDALPSPSLVVREGKIIAFKGDITLEGYTWSASKMLTALIFARERFLGNVDYSNTVPNSDNPTSPLATYQHFLSMTSDYGLSPHSPGDHYAYNNAAVHHYGTHLKDTFYASQNHVQTLQSAYVTALNFEDDLIYETTTWAGDNHMSGWNGGWKMSTRDLARICQLILQRGMWNGTQILDPDYCIRMWALSIPEAATQSTDEDDEFYNQVGTSDVMKPEWGLGFWYLPTVGAQHEANVMFGKYGTSAYICRQKDIIAVACNVGGTTDDSSGTKILRSQFEALVDSVTTPDSQFIASSAIDSAQAFGTSRLNRAVAPAGVSSAEAIGASQINQTLTATAIASAEDHGSTTVSTTGGGLTLSPIGISTAEAVGTSTLNRTTSLTGTASSETFGTTSLGRTVSLNAIPSSEAFGTSFLSRTIQNSGINSGELLGTARINRTITSLGITSGETFGASTVARGSVAISLTAIASAESFGTPTITPQNTIALNGISTSETFGLIGLNRTVSVTGIASAADFGGTIVQGGAATISPSGIDSSEVFGTAAVQRGSVTLTLSSIGTGEAFGSAVLQSVKTLLLSGISTNEGLGSAKLSLAVSAFAIDSAEALGTSAVQSGSITVALTSINSTEAVGTATVSNGSVLVGVNAIPSGEVFGTAALSRYVHTLGIASGETVSSPLIQQALSMVAIGSLEAFGSASLNFAFQAGGIPSSESFGAFTINRGSVSIVLTGIGSAAAFGQMTVGVDISPQPFAIITVMSKPIATLSVQSKPTATITKWPS